MENWSARTIFSGKNGPPLQIFRRTKISVTGPPTTKPGSDPLIGYSLLCITLLLSPPPKAGKNDNNGPSAKRIRLTTSTAPVHMSTTDAQVSRDCSKGFLPSHKGVFLFHRAPLHITPQQPSPIILDMQHAPPAPPSPPLPTSQPLSTTTHSIVTRHWLVGQLNQSSDIIIHDYIIIKLVQV